MIKIEHHKSLEKFQLNILILSSNPHPSRNEKRGDNCKRSGGRMNDLSVPQRGAARR